MGGPKAVTRRAGHGARRALLLALICAVAAGCGGGDNTPSAGQQEPARERLESPDVARMPAARCPGRVQ